MYLTLIKRISLSIRNDKIFDVAVVKKFSTLMPES